MTTFGTSRSRQPFRRQCFMLLALAALTSISPARAARIDRYVDKASPNPASPYDSWTNASHDIQSAIDVAVVSEDDEVIVRAGVYDTGGTLYLACTNRVFIDRAIVVRSEDNDPETTIIKGAWDPVGTNGPAAVRCVYMVGGASLIGFTLTNGATVRTGDYRSNCGGGVFARTPSSVISNCVIAGNTAWGDSGNGIGGGGLHGGVAHDSRILGNRVGTGRRIGGGTFDATLYNCLIAGNVAEQGGGAFRSTLYDCVVSNNTAIKMTDSYSTGGGIAGWSPTLRCAMYGGLLIGNSADRGGGAGGYTILSNVTVTLNSVPVTDGQQGYGGGLYIPTEVTGCMIVSNTSPIGAGGYQGNYTNCTFAHQSVGVYGPNGLNNCLFYGHATAVNMVWLPRTIENCTFVGNGNGIVDYYASGVLQIRNSIAYSNTANWVLRDATMVFSNTCTTPAYGGWDASNITDDPRLISYGSGFGTSHVPGDYRLGAGSPCLNAGLNQAWMIGAVDLDGNPRMDKVTGTVDMGCYEHVYHEGTLLILR